MDTANRIVNGIHLDNNQFDQPDNTMRDSRNGIIYDVETGNYIWKPIKGTISNLTLAANDRLMRYANIRDRHFILILNTVSDYVKLTELIINASGNIASTVVIWQSTNTLMTLDINYPIRSMFGIYENDNIVRMYINDYHNPPRVLNIAGTPPVSINEKFINFTPVIDNVYGNIALSELSGGSLKAGTYFFAWRLFKDGYYTDWSYLSNPFPIFNGLPGSSFDDYQEIEGQNPDIVTSKGIQINITNIDDDYDVIQIAAFYSNDFNSVGPGTIIYESSITGTTISYSYYGGENAGTITINELLETSILITKCKDMTLAGKYNVLANIEERSELDVSSLHSQGKNNQMEVSILPSQYFILLDTTDPNFWGTYDALYGILNGTDISRFGVIDLLYHYAVTEVRYSDLSGAHVIPAGSYFKVGPLANYTSGTARLATVIKKYRKASATIPYDLNDDYSLETTQVINNYYNYKNPLFANKFKGYPSGEKIRLGILFFDKTGRPFFVRHLYNTETTIGGKTIGPGDTRVPDINENSPYYSCISFGQSALPPYWYSKNIGSVNYFSISGIDITPIKDEIGGFAIVRCPIERENLAYGALAFTYHNGNDIYTAYGFRGYSGDVSKYKGAYCFYSPEDMFDLDGFSIQPGDKLVNKYYLTPTNPASTDISGCEGFGDEMSVNNLYQMFYVHSPSTDTGNAAIGAEHEILFSTKYRQGDGDEIIIDPRDETKLLRYQHPTIYGDGGFTHITSVNILVLDIDDVAPDVKGRFNLASTAPAMLVCSIKRPISSPYGGSSDSALASSLYISTGHFQIVDATVLADIEDGGNYVFNEVEVFGGDTYKCIWDFMRTMRNEDVVGTKHGQSFLMPIETRINLDLREGNHVGRLRAYSVAYPDGLRWLTGSNKWEEFNYNDGYSSDVIGKYYLPVPINFRLENKFDTDVRWSDPKEYGEYVDSFRVFKPLNKITLDKKFGEVNNIRYKFNNLIYWQKGCVGYIPLNERALTSNEIGNVIQLGVSGIFDRNDQLVEFVGNSNQFGLVESNDGFHWFDAVKKMFVSINSGLKIGPDSIIHGLDRWFINELPENMDSYDNPSYNYGINGGFDPRSKMVFMTFRTATVLETIGFNIKAGKFEGFFDLLPRHYFDIRDYLFVATDSVIHKHGVGALGTFFGTLYPQYLTIIVNDKNMVDRVFDTFELIGNDKFFDQVIYTLEDGTTITEYLTGSQARYVRQKISYRNKRWFGNFPRISRERLVGSYCKITFVNTGTGDARFILLKTGYRDSI